MNSNNQRIILFPRVKENWLEEAANAFRDKEFEKSLQIYRELIRYGETEYEILFGKLLCLVELKEYDLAQEICKQNLESDRINNIHYYDYFYIYITVLFQTEQYDVLLEKLDEELSNPHLPPYLLDYMENIHELSVEIEKSRIDKKEKDLYQGLEKAFNSNNVIEQITTIKELEKIKSKPKNEIIPLLKDEQIHPVVKTSLLLWLHKCNINQQVTIEKLGILKEINLNEIESLEDNPLFVIEGLNKFTNEHDPVLLNMMNQMLYRYLFVTYPFIPKDEEIIDIVYAMELMIKQNLYSELNEEIDEATMLLINKIKMYETIYLSVIHE